MTTHPDDILAAEYVLGVLEADARATVETRMARDPAFADAVARWQDRLSPLDAAYAPVDPPAALKSRIAARLFPEPPRRRFGWFAALAGGAVAAALLAGVLVWQGPPAPALQAGLQAEGAPVAFAARLDGAVLTVTRSAGAAAPAGQDYQLWRIGADGVPQSLGLLRGAETRLPGDGLAAGLVLAVSVEPAGGAPGPLPTGPVILTAALQAP
jgi:anti-sigma-K factor RskA